MKKIICCILSALLSVFAFVGCNNDTPNRAEETVYLYQASEATAEKLFNVAYSTAEITYGTFVAPDSLPGMFDQDCTGATKVAFHSQYYNKYDKVYLQLNYTIDELRSMKDKYKSAKFSVYFETPSGVDIIYQVAQSHIFSFVEFFNSGWNNNQVHKKVWSTYEIMIEDLISAMQAQSFSPDSKTVYVFAGYFSDGDEILDKTMNVYLTDITLVKKAGV